MEKMSLVQYKTSGWNEMKTSGYKTSGWNEMVEMTFQPLLTCFFAINTFICCVVNHRICIQSHAMCLKLAYLTYLTLYADKVNFVILWVYLHCYDLSPLQQIYPTLTNGWIVYCASGVVYYQLSCNKFVKMHFPWQVKS